MNAHFFDFNSIVTINSKVWIVDRQNPNVPLMRMPKYEFSLIKKGVYRKDNLKFRIAGVDYWLSEKLFNNIKISCKNNNIDVSNLSFSMQEFMNPDIIEKDDYKIHIENLEHIKNTKADVFLICAKNTKVAYEKIMDKLNEKLEDVGVKIKKVYYLSETFYNRDNDAIRLNKVKILIQNLIGNKIQDNMFNDVIVERYDNIYFYESDIKTVEMAKDINNTIKFLIDNTEEEVRDSIRDIIRNDEPLLIVKQITFNKANLFVRKEVPIVWNSIVKAFENFKYKH